MKCTVLVENSVCDDRFGCEHGLSLSLQSEGRHWLFDMGQGSLFFETAQRLSLSLDTVEAMILSHGHYDHGGGLALALQHIPHCPVYLSAFAFEPHYNGQEKEIGLAPTLAHAPQLRFVRDAYELSPTVRVVAFPKERQCEPIDTGGLFRREGETFLPEDFRHEIALSFYDKGRHIVVSGCAHCGVLNWVTALRPDIFIGGFHLSKWDVETPAGRQRLQHLGERLKALPTNYFTGHCTGDPQYAILKEILGERLTRLSTGLELII